MRTTALILSGAFMAATLSAADIPPDQLDFFEKKVKPILTDRCYKCHSAEAGKSKGGLLLDSRDASRKGGDTGPAVIPGDVNKSLLITAINYKDADLQMPPKGEKLKDQEIADLTEWIKMGAPDNREAKGGKLSGLTDHARQHWSYQPVKKPAMPAVKNRAWCVTPVDMFVLEKIEAKGMIPASMADKETLLRRASYDLIGLPPTPKEIEDFTSDNTPYAFVKVVDRLLASPHYGERWGRFWLDTARYSDTTGDRVGERNADYRFPYAWTYRDYVVRSFNEDKPYDRFVLEQLAADKLTDLKDQRDLAALGFITVGKRGTSVNDMIDDRIDTVSKGFLGMTVACARCHDHMFDPIPTKDYYALHGVFASIDEPKEKPVITQADKASAAEFQTKMAALNQANQDNYYKSGGGNNAAFRKQADSYLKSAYLTRPKATADEQKAGGLIRETEKHNREVTQSITRGWRDKANKDLFYPLQQFEQGNLSTMDFSNVNPIVAAAFKGKDLKTLDEVMAVYGKLFKDAQAKADEYEKSLIAAKTPDSKIETKLDAATIQLVQFPLVLSPAKDLNVDEIRKEIERWPLALRTSRNWAFAKINSLLLTDAGSDARAMVVEDIAKPKDSPVFIRGQADAKGDLVPRHFLEILSGGKPTPFRDGSGRLELAEAIASKNNPLTARVIVNRVWMHHFGEGFVRTPDDLGTQAENPTHPELLDYLSSYLMEQGWSLKKLHRLIMLSKVYQISSQTNKAFETIDPENRLLWRANVRRLDFEAMRDSLLVMAGKLDETVGGQPVNLTDEPYSDRRSIYGYVDRGNLPELMSHFDFSNPEAPNSKRTSTIVPQQALFLMNSPMSVDVARNILKQPSVTRSSTPRDVVFAIYRVVLGRAPRAEEMKTAYEFIGYEGREEGRIQDAAKVMTAKAEKKAEEAVKKAEGQTDQFSAVRNEGDIVERKPLTAWETFAQALMLTNEAAYVN